jgi:hypothetical protein
MGIFGENNRPGFDLMANIYSPAPFPDTAMDKQVRLTPKDQSTGP